MNHFYMNSDHAYHNNVITDSIWRATDRIFDRIERGNIVSVRVGVRRVKLTLAERYTLYKEKYDALQRKVLATATANPDEPLLNMYTHVFIMSEKFATDEFLDSEGVPRYKGEPFTRTELEKLADEWEKELDACV